MRHSLHHHYTTKLIYQATEKLSYITQIKEKIRKKKGSSINFYSFVFDLFTLFFYFSIT